MLLFLHLIHLLLQPMLLVLLLRRLGHAIKEPCNNEAKTVSFIAWWQERGPYNVKSLVVLDMLSLVLTQFESLAQ